MSDTASRTIAAIVGEISQHGLESLRPRLLREPPPPVPQHGDYDLNPSFKPDPARRLKQAAVLLPIVARAEPTVLFTQRTEHLAQHAGQVSFPGGRVEPSDLTIVETALRETHEETGIEPSFVTVAGYTDAFETGTGFAIQPVIGLLTEGFSLLPNPGEVAKIFEVPLAWLLDPANRETGTREWQGKPRRFYAFRYEDQYIWGATAAILVNFSERLRT